MLRGEGFEAAHTRERADDAQIATWLLRSGRLLTSAALVAAVGLGAYAIAVLWLDWS